MLMLAEIDITSLTSGSGIVVAIYCAVQFSRLVGSIVLFANAARAWCEEEAKARASTLEHHRRMETHVEREEHYQQALLGRFSSVPTTAK